MAAHPVDSGPGARVTGIRERPAGRAGMVRNVRIGRQGIYDAHRQLVSYELLFRSPGSGPADEVAGEQATSQVIASTFGTFGLENISDGRPVFINFTRAFLTGIIPIPVPPDNVIIEVVEQVDVDHELLLGLAQLRASGYRIAVDNYHGDLARSALVEIADFVKINVNVLPTMVVPGLVQQCRSAGATLLATGVEDGEVFTRCVGLGFELFQGYYLQRPMVLEQRTLSPSQAICVKLLNDLADPQVPIQRIEEMVGSDPGLTLRLLRTANSASAGVGREVTSLRQALVLIGPRLLRSWVVLTLLEGGTVRSASDDLWSVLARAHACQRLAVHESDLAFTVGLLSGAADLLDSDPAEIADRSGVGSEAKEALLDGGGEAGRALRAVLAHEKDNPEGISDTGFVPFDVSRAYLESLSESLKLVHELLEPEKYPA
ncbi:MAG TPA: HDOD domain-containing protein [Kineosporiaceae bacterium]|nr:HDOD domain-containing protein [Kineosporiaceae bacterium]